ncbi:MAG: HAMP domain-containing histidine kinase [Lachnospira sp.]|nr:HAMP domain-containing histidine kinase [Lachnospira sp.]
MKIFRNPEVIKTFIVYIVCGIVFVATAYFIEPKLVLVSLGLWACCVIIYIYSMSKMYKRIGELSKDINNLLHGKEDIYFDDCKEGELGVLQSEIYKMTIRLKKQQKLLEEDKIYLANSIADISHQIKTPLTSINILVSMLSEENISVERKVKLTRELYEMLSRIEWMITTLLKISRLDAGMIKFKKEELSLRELINRAVEPLEVSMELKEQRLVTNISGQFVGDVNWTSEAITNIIKNCMEHTPQNGTLTIEASNNPIFTEIVIKDSGSGIKKEDLPHIFERFYKGSDSNNTSFGIGLSLARMIITAQNGTIKADNEKEGGARFVIRMYPIMDEQK